MDKIALIRQEIERRIKELSEAETDYREEGCDSISALLISGISELQKILSFISTLESEQPDKSLEEKTCKGFEEEFRRFIKKEKEKEPDKSLPYYGDYGIYRVARHFVKWGEEHLANVGKTSPKDLEEAANNYLDGVYGKMPHSDYHIAIFIAGAKWQANHVPLPKDTVLFQKGVEKGKRLMLEEAVECSVYAGKEGDKWIVSYIGNYESMLKTCKGGDTVRIIVLPKEDEK